GRPAADDELLLRPDLDLQPGRRPATGLVGRAAELGHDALEPALAGRLVERPAVTLDVGGVADTRRFAQDAAEEPLPILERDAEQRAAVEVEQVERLVEQAARGAASAVAAVAAFRAAGPARTAPALADRLLQQREVRHTLLVDRHHLAVDDRGLGGDPRRVCEEAREVGRTVEAAPGERPDRAIL